MLEAFEASDEPPERWWVLEPIYHCSTMDPPTEDRWICQGCAGSIATQTPTGRTQCIPIYRGRPICGRCVRPIIDDHPMTTDYLDWLDSGDHRWWSAWVCSCTGCVISISIEKVKDREQDPGRLQPGGS